MWTLYDTKAWIRNLLFRLHIPPRGRPDVYVGYMQRYRIDVVFDVGANNGHYGRHIRARGYQGRIVSFEPLPDAFAKLRANARGFAEWQTVQTALGAYDGECTLNVAGNSQSSSLKPMEALHRGAAPHSAYVGTVSVPIRRLDSILDGFTGPADRCYLKLDVQGSEMDVLRGATHSLSRFDGVQLEMAVEPLYQGETLLKDLLEFMDEQGYCLMTLQPGFGDHRTGQVLQFDGVFFRRDVVKTVRDGR